MYGGPAYILRNVFQNVIDEQVKYHSGGGVEPSGVLVYHNTFVSSRRALNMQTPPAITGHNIRVRNNLFVGPRRPVGRTVEWAGSLDDAVFDHNGYFPDGGFQLGVASAASFAQLQGLGGFETSGVLLSDPIFAADLVGPERGQDRAVARDVALDQGSNAIDRGAIIAGVNQGFSGLAPDLGAREAGSPRPAYGPRPEGMEATTELVDWIPDATRH